MSAASTSPAPTSAPPSEALPTAEQHGIKEHSDGRFGFVPVQTRSARFKSFDVTDFPAVTGREAVWKLSPVAKFTDLTAGELDGSVYETLVTPHPDVDVSWVDRTDPRIGTAGAPEERAAANAWTSFDKALAITVTGDDAKEITLTRANLGTGARAAHTIIEAKPFSRAVVILQNTGDARITENIEIILGDSANLTVVTVQEWNDDAVQLAGPGSDTELFGLYFADSGQHLEQQVYVNHDAPNSRSRVNYKGALQGAGARTVWIGDVLIGRTAPGTDSYEQNRNLVLTEGTRADSIPNLEIETGDIQGAGHASATGRFDDEQLFYLQSRGIGESEARRLVVRGFLSEIVQHIGSPALEERLQGAIEDELRGTEGN
jgi:Fe-S cluster assembly protein SufD